MSITLPILSALIDSQVSLTSHYFLFVSI